MANEGDLPLSDVRVLDLSRLLPGPYASLILADLGARVDKVEDPAGGDYLRQMPPLLGDESALFFVLNRNKRSLALDLKTQAGASALKRLVKGYDVLMESFRPGVMEKLGLSYESLSAENPSLVYCSISGYGQTGPDRLRAGHDLNYIARSGVLGYGGEAGGGPPLPPVQMADIGGGSLFALVGILTALHERRRTGRGRWVDVAMSEGSLAFLHVHLAARLALGTEGLPLRRGREPLNGGYACYSVYRTADGRYLSVGALEPKFFAAFCDRLGRPDLAAEGYDLETCSARARGEIAALLEQKPLAHWVERFAGSDVCVEPVLEGDEVLNDRQLRSRGVFVEGPGPQEGRPMTHLRTPLRFGELPLRPPPGLGQDGAAILSEAGFSKDEIASLTGVRRA